MDVYPSDLPTDLIHASINALIYIASKLNNTPNALDYNFRAACRGFRINPAMGRVFDRTAADFFIRNNVYCYPTCAECLVKLDMALSEHRVIIPPFNSVLTTNTYVFQNGAIIVCC